MFKGYGLWDLCSLLISKLYTQFLFPRQRLIRFSCRIRGKNQIEFSHNFSTGVRCRIDVLNLTPYTKAKLILGENLRINDDVHIACCEKITIGNNVLIASKVFITDHNHGSSYPIELITPPYLRTIVTKPISIGDNVWIGENVVILPGVIIGRNTIIGASSVVTKNLPDNSICVGNPCKVIKISE